MATVQNSNLITSQEQTTRRQFLKALAILPASALPAALVLPAVSQEAPNGWRRTWPEFENVSQANAARLQTWELDLYPTLYPGSEPNPAHVTNMKASLHQIIEELSEDDLDGVYRLARMYALFPDTEGRVQAEQLKGWNWQAQMDETE